jgi:aminopeptidase-like protein
MIGKLTYSILSLASLVGADEEVYCQNFGHHLEVLCSDTLAGRLPGSDGEKKAMVYIESQLSNAYKFKAQAFAVTSAEQGKTAVNLFCIPLSKGVSDSTILLIAHYDHLGNGAFKSLEILESKRLKIHPGADDNASGVAMVIELGKWYQGLTEKKYQTFLLFTSAHEEGLFGSENFVKANNIDSMKIKAVFNFDMVGRLDETSRSLSISDNKNEIAYYDSIPSSFHLMKEDIIQHSDLKYFASYPIHLVSITTGVHSDYHRITDTPDKINYEGMNDIFEYMKKVILKIA